MKEVKCVKLTMRTVGVIAITSARADQNCCSDYLNFCIDFSGIKETKELIFFLVSSSGKIKCIIYKKFFASFSMMHQRQFSVTFSEISKMPLKTEYL